MIDVLNTAKESISGDGRSSIEINAREGQFYLATIHRQENSDIEDRLREIIDALSELDLPTYIPSHPRLVKKCKEFDIELNKGSLRSIDPLSYRELVAAVIEASISSQTQGDFKGHFILERRAPLLEQKQSGLKP